MTEGRENLCHCGLQQSGAKQMLHLEMCSNLPILQLKYVSLNSQLDNLSVLFHSAQDLYVLALLLANLPLSSNTLEATKMQLDTWAPWAAVAHGTVQLLLFLHPSLLSPQSPLLCYSIKKLIYDLHPSGHCCPGPIPLLVQFSPADLNRRCSLPTAVRRSM